jgi:diadenosine tetraphosphate (Ap4A) HIT family hydrolase
MVVPLQPETDCPICAKHRGEGPLVGHVVGENELLLVSHRPVGDDGTAALGYLFVEPRRHVPYLDDLTEAEAEAIGRVVRRAAAGLRTELAVDFVFSIIAGMSVAHFHQHLFVRHAGTPEEFGFMAGHEWADAPRGDAQAIEELCGRLKPYLDL